jgi:hypothetical protein
MLVAIAAPAIPNGGMSRRFPNVLRMRVTMAKIKLAPTLPRAARSFAMTRPLDTRTTPGKRTNNAIEAPAKSGSNRRPCLLDQEVGQSKVCCQVDTNHQRIDERTS